MFFFFLCVFVFCLFFWFGLCDCVSFCVGGIQSFCWKKGFTNNFFCGVSSLDDIGSLKISTSPQYRRRTHLEHSKIKVASTLRLVFSYSFPWPHSPVRHPIVPNGAGRQEILNMRVWKMYLPFKNGNVGYIWVSTQK